MQHSPMTHEGPHLLDLLRVQLGDVENLLGLLEAEAREVGCGCRLVPSTTPSISSCLACCGYMGDCLAPLVAQSFPQAF